MLKTIALVVILGAVSASLVVARAHSQNRDGQDRKTSDQAIDVGSATQLQVKVPLGTVVLIADGSRELTVHAVRSTRTPLDEFAKKWMSKSYLTAENRDGVLTVRDHPFGLDSLKDIHDNNEHGVNHGNRNFDLKVEIHVPADLAAKLDVTAGTADVRGGFRSLIAQVSAGDLIAKGLRCEGKTELHVGAGKLAASLDKDSKGDSSLRVGAGEVKLTIPSGTDADVSADVSIGEIKGLPDSAKSKDEIKLGDKRRGRIGRGDVKVGIHVGAGSIEVESSDVLQALTYVTGPSSDSVDDELHIGSSVDDAVSEGLNEALKALKSIHIDIKDDDGDRHIGSGDIGAAVQKALSKVKPEVERAIHEAAEAVDKATDKN